LKKPIISESKVEDTPTTTETETKTTTETETKKTTEEAYIKKEMEDLEKILKMEMGADLTELFGGDEFELDDIVMGADLNSLFGDEFEQMMKSMIPEKFRGKIDELDNDLKDKKCTQEEYEERLEAIAKEMELDQIPEDLREQYTGLKTRVKAIATETDKIYSEAKFGEKIKESKSLDEIIKLSEEIEESIPTELKEQATQLETEAQKFKKELAKRKMDEFLNEIKESLPEEDRPKFETVQAKSKELLKGFEKLAEGLENLTEEQKEALDKTVVGKFEKLENEEGLKTLIDETVAALPKELKEIAKQMEKTAEELAEEFKEEVKPLVEETLTNIYDKVKKAEVKPLVKETLTDIYDKVVPEVQKTESQKTL